MHGHLTLITGPMMAGKSTRILDLYHKAIDEDRRNAVLIKPDFDSRYSCDEVVTHDERKMPAISIRNWSEIAHIVDQYDLLIFDEIQFFDGEITAVIASQLRSGRDVICSGLDLDINGNPWRVTADIAAMSDIVEKRVARCTICRRPASKTMLKGVSGTKGPYVELGHSDRYEPRCNRHWPD